MPDLTIDRLSLHLSGLSEGDSRHLVRLISEGLASAPLTGSGLSLADMQVEVAASPGVSVPELSDKIIADVLRQLGRVE